MKIIFDSEEQKETILSHMKLMGICPNDVGIDAICREHDTCEECLEKKFGCEVKQ